MYIFAIAPVPFVFFGLFLVAVGLFPEKPGLPGSSTAAPAVERQFEKLVFVVIDALRSDLMFGIDSQFHYVHTLIQTGKALPFTGYSTPPTVTLPRLKGLTSGASPNFLDAVFNIAESESSVLKVDNWISQMVNDGRRIKLFGDDTWLKLFPQAFVEADGTSSFYVSDYTEVDNNVTRHIDTQLASNDWDTLILHYLGLDHIGHKSGPFSSLMAPKQREMDQVIERIYNSSGDDTLIVVVGDHGMTDAGNHGGSTTGETSAAMLLVSPKFTFSGNKAPSEPSGAYSFYQKIQQTDIVPTISLLLGLPVPRNSVGLPIEQVLTLWGDDDRKKAVDSVCEQISGLTTLDECSVAGLQRAREKLTTRSNGSGSSRTDMTMYLGLALLALTVVWTSLSFLALPISATAKLSWGAVSILYGVMMFGSSTVEEEHQFWFWALTACATGVYVLSRRLITTDFIIALLGVRLMRGWHSLGQKWHQGFTVSSGLYDHPTLTWILIVLVASNALVNPNGGIRSLVGICAMALALWFKATYNNASGDPLPRFMTFLALGEDNLLLLARAFFAVAGLIAVASALSAKLRLGLLELVLLVQLRVTNIPLIIIWNALSGALRRAFKRKGPDTDAYLSLSILMLQYVSFFSTGGSNSLATIDLSNAYNGVASYNLPVVSILTFLSNWAGPVYWSGVASEIVADSKLRSTAMVWFYSIHVLSISLACVILREHLFIWTVFSPKILYSVAWLGLQTVVIDLVVVPLISAKEG